MEPVILTWLLKLLASEESEYTLRLPPLPLEASPRTTSLSRPIVTLEPSCEMVTLLWFFVFLSAEKSTVVPGLMVAALSAASPLVVNFHTALSWIALKTVSPVTSWEFLASTLPVPMALPQASSLAFWAASFFLVAVSLVSSMGLLSVSNCTLPFSSVL